MFWWVLPLYRKTNGELRKPGPESMRSLKQKTSVEKRKVKKKVETQKATKV